MFLIPLVRLPGLETRVFSCRECGTPIAREEHLLAVMGRPVKATYHNPQGVPCEILTFEGASNVIGADFSTEDYSWFEGYAWRPVGCGKCRIHVGWRFEASEPYLDPQDFFGLLARALREERRKE